MAESFKSYNTSILSNTGSSPKTIIVVPSGKNTSNTITWENNKTVSRDIDSYAQLHSIYISQRAISKIAGLNRYNPANFSAFNLYIEDVDASYKTYIVYDGRIVPGSPFFIEKNITLEPSQQLVLECPNDSQDIDTSTNTIVSLNKKPNIYLDISVSGILLK